MHFFSLSRIFLTSTLLVACPAAFAQSAPAIDSDHDGLSDEFEQTLRRALRPRHPDEDFAERVVSSLDSNGTDSSGTEPASVTRLESRMPRRMLSRWLAVALAACVIAAVGLIQFRQHALDAARATQAREQLLQALSIASDNVNIVRTTVAHEENPDS